MGKVILECDFCRKSILRYPSKVKGKNFCSKECMNKYASKEFNPEGYAYRDFTKNSERFKVLNKLLNPVRMNLKTRTKLRVKHLGRGEGKSYTKIYGRHAHRVVAEQILGRPLRKGEVVHHVDGNKRNNNPENLIVFASQRKHAAFHNKEKKFFESFAVEGEVMPK